MIRARRTFTLGDQLRFAEISGDWNPVHVDEVYARKTAVGLTVHGMHTTLWALREFLNDAPILVGSLRATFFKPVPVGAEVRLEVEWDAAERAHWLNVFAEGGLAASIRVGVGQNGPVDDMSAEHRILKRMAPESIEFSAISSLRIEDIAVASDLGMEQDYPVVLQSMGRLRLAALLSLTRIVGMKCPGLNSLMGGFDLVSSADTRPEILFEVRRCTLPAAPIKVNFRGGGWNGFVTVFFRPKPVAQITYAEALKRYRGGSLKGMRALVVGGSRGIGEVATKLVAAGGGEVLFSYFRGAEDAVRITEEIRSGSGRCREVMLDVRNISHESAAAVLAFQPTHIFYFATPVIRSGGDEFDLVRHQEFLAYYVEGVRSLCELLGAVGSWKFFYPSTVYIDAPVRGLSEYIQAKIEGEKNCEIMGEAFPFVSFYIKRLPRLLTDQTNSLVGFPALDPVDVVLDVINTVTSRC